MNSKVIPGGVFLGDLLNKKSWDTWIRTTMDGFKVRCSAIELYPINK